jgi:cell wall-associated NlpC family hydrolase
MKFTFISIFVFGSFLSKSMTTLKSPLDSIQVDSLIAYSKTFIGTNYKYGSCSPKTGFDCSGFVYYVFSHFGVKVPRTSADFNKAGITINPDSFMVGDVIVFTGTNAKNRTPGHVGIVISNYDSDLQFMHSSSSKKHSGVKISSYKESPYYEKRFLKIVRITKLYR